MRIELYKMQMQKRLLVKKCAARCTQLPVALPHDKYHRCVCATVATSSKTAAGKENALLDCVVSNFGIGVQKGVCVTEAKRTPQVQKLLLVQKVSPGGSATTCGLAARTTCLEL